MPGENDNENIIFAHILYRCQKLAGQAYKDQEALLNFDLQPNTGTNDDKSGACTDLPTEILK